MNIGYKKNKKFWIERCPARFDTIYIQDLILFRQSVSDCESERAALSQINSTTVL